MIHQRRRTLKYSALHAAGNVDSFPDLGGAMRRREFIALTGGVIAGWPFTAHAQYAKKPVIGYINSRSPSESTDIVAAFRQGLKEVGFDDGENVTIESRFAVGD